MSLPQKKCNTKQRQYDVMVDFMVKHPDLAKGHLNVPNVKSKSKELWDRLTLDLNSTGPPTNDSTKWKKVWADYKNHVKVKCRQNKNSLSGTGGGPSKFCSLTQLEEKIVDLLSIDKAVSGIDGTYRFGVNTKENTPPTTTLDIVQDSLMENFINIASDEPTPIPSEKISPGISPTGNQRTQVQSKESLLQKQVGNQIKYQENSIKLMTEVDKNIKGCLSVLNNANENLSEVKKYLKRSCEWQENHYRLAKEKFEFKKKIELESSKQKTLQYELKKQISDCQENKYKLAKEKFEFKKKIELENTKQKMKQLELKKEILEIKSNKYKPAE